MTVRWVARRIGRRLRQSPLFLLALTAAFVYERSGLLVAPMLTHAVYNAVILGAALLR